MRNSSRTAIGIIIGFLTLGWPDGSWADSPIASDMHDRVDAALSAQAGGVQTGWNEITWDSGATVLTLAPTFKDDGGIARAAVGGCDSGKFCAYSQSGYLGNKITYSTCTSNHSVAALGGTVRSVVNLRTSGNVKAYSGRSVLATVQAGRGSNVVGSTEYLACS